MTEAPSLSRTVRLLLVDGVPNGLITAELINWSGKVLSSARTRLADLLRRDEAARTGIYVLHGEDPQHPGRPWLYVGEADSVRDRLRQHDADPSNEFWERTLVVVSKDDNLTKAHGRYLERRLLEIASRAGRSQIKNSQRGSAAALVLPEADRADMEGFLEQVLLIMPLLGLEAFRLAPPRSEARGGATMADSPVFVIDTKEQGTGLRVLARAQLVGDAFVVLQGSTGRVQAGSQNNYARLRRELMDTGKLVPDLDHPATLVRFVEDVPFPSPSAAAAVVLNRNSNGRTEWWTEDGTSSFADWSSTRVDNAVTETPGRRPAP